MSPVSEHYANHLGPVYAWMAGGIESAIECGAAELRALNIPPAAGALAVDLGAGFGMHAIPLARLGYAVLAIDSCAVLLDELRACQSGLPIEIVEDDMLAFRARLTEPPQAIFCMGDTITHLPDSGAVLQLVSEAASALRGGGYFVVTFRDYASALMADQRFIAVRSDEHRILTCFLEYAETHVTVHDLLHERGTTGWQLSVGSYRKLRLAPAWLAQALESAGFSVRREPGLAGMVRLVAQRVC